MHAMICTLSASLSLLVNCLFASLSLGVGVGWWLNRSARNEESSDAANEQAKKALAQLKGLAESVARDVGEHNMQVAEINQKLTDSAGSGDDLEQIMLGSVAKLMQANEALQSQLVSAEDKLHEQAQEIETVSTDARTDALTQLVNRRGFDDEMARKLAEWRRNETPYCLLIMDIDHFKSFNDTHGHQAGDEVLRSVGTTLDDAMRDMDVVCRYGGEEFAVIMPATTVAEAQRGAERARNAIEAMTVRFEGKQLKVTASQGLAEITAADDAESLIQRADTALYASKEAGRNCGHFHTGTESVPFAIDHENSGKSMDASAAGFVQVREAFLQDLSRRVAECHRFGGDLSVIVLEVTNLDEIMRIGGSELCEQVLETVSGFLGSAFREMDTVSRIALGEFASMLPGTPINGVKIIADRVQAAIAACKLPLEGHELSFEVRCGLSQFVGSDTAESLMERAENGRILEADTSAAV